MKSRSSLLCTGFAIVFSCTLSACVTTEPTKPAAALPPPKIENMMADANAASASGKTDEALAILKNATNTFPAEKAPWAQIAQIKFDGASYGEAIVNAQEVLLRDPSDKLANSIIAVSGLRLSTKSLTDLSQQNNLTGSLRTEAQDLAKLLRETLGENVLVPAKTKPVNNTARSSANRKNDPRANPAHPADNEQGRGNPFGVLK